MSIEVSERRMNILTEIAKPNNAIIFNLFPCLLFTILDNDSLIIKELHIVAKNKK